MRLSFMLRFGERSGQVYDVEVDETLTVAQAFEMVRDAAEAQGDEVDLPVDELGHPGDIEFAWEGEPLDPRKPLRDCAMGEDAMIVVAPAYRAGAPLDVSRSSLLYHRIGLKRFLIGNAEVIPWYSIKPAEITLKFAGVPGISSVSRDGEPQVVKEHMIRLQAPIAFPRDRVHVLPLSPIWHPNVSMEEKDICYTVDWPGDQDDLLSWVVEQVIRVITYQRYSTDPPHDRMNPDAMRWFSKWKQEKPDYFPLQPLPRVRIPAQSTRVVLGTLDGRRDGRA